VHGTATLATGALPVGTNTVTADFSGSSAFLSSATAPGTPMISAPVPLDAVVNPTYSVAEDSSGDYFVSSCCLFGYEVLMDKGGTISDFASGGTNLSAGFTGPATGAELGTPWGIAVYNGTVYFADAGLNVVHAVDVSSDTMTTYAGTGSQSPSASVGVPATSAKLDGPAGIAFDGSGNLFIADYYGNEVLEVNGQTQKITTIAGDGTRGYSGDSGLATSAELDDPSGVAVDSSGDVFIADTGNNVVREVKPGPDGLLTDGTITTVAGGGANASPIYSGPALSAQLR
jgi:hypothetical protein